MKDQGTFVSFVSEKNIFDMTILFSCRKKERAGNKKLARFHLTRGVKAQRLFASLFGAVPAWPGEP